MNRIKLAGAAAVGALALSFTGLAGTAHADLASDLQIMAGNAPATVNALVDGVQSALATYEATDSIDAAAQTFVFSLVNTGNVLGAGTEQFGSLGLGLALVGLGTYAAITPYTQALDDPSLLTGLVDGNDLTTLLANLSPAIAVAQPAFVSALAQALQGNITAGTGFNAGLGQPALEGDAFAGFRDALYALTANTHFVDAPLAIIAIVGVAGIATASYVQQAEDGLAPVFAALAPVTDPIVAALGG